MAKPATPRKRPASRPKAEKFGQRRLEVRNARVKDIPGIANLVRRVYNDMPAYTHGEIRGQINNFREGCFVALLDEQVIGYCATMQVAEALAFQDHDWDEITGNGFGSRHDPTGDWLYGYEMCVDPKVRGVRIGRRLYEERRALAEDRDLKGIVFAGRMPNYRRNKRKVDGPADYLDQVVAGKLHDPVLRFQLANGFEPERVIEDYLPEDKASEANAVMMVWRNPYVESDQPAKKRLPARGRERARGNLPAPGTRRCRLRRIPAHRALFRRRRERLRKRFHPLSRAIYADAAELRGEGIVAGRGDRAAFGIYSPS